MHNFSNGSQATQPETMHQREIRLSRKLALENLSTHDLQLWHDYACVDRLQLCIGQKLVLWHFPHIWSGPEVIKAYRLMSIYVNQEHATYVIVDAENLTQIVDNTPQLFLDSGVFAWIPFHNTMRHHPVETNERPFLTTSLCVRQQTNPNRVRVAGHRYLTTLKDFERNWETSGVTADA